jgi:hypothetical protein
VAAVVQAEQDARRKFGGCFGRLTQVRSGSKQLVKHGGFLGGGQGIQRRAFIVRVRSLSSGDGTGGACVLP